jgi:hypothetical protein
MAPSEYETPEKQIIPPPGEYTRPGSSEYASHRDSAYYHPDYAYYPAYYFAQRHPHHQPANQDWSQSS